MTNYEIKLKYYQSQNYTPADVMRRWAMENFKYFGRDIGFKPYILIDTKKYYYDHWKIEKHEDRTETVTLFLTIA
ncbi:MAG: hypothetical protein E7405_01135 [Ruminococcaceae bacterium]|nr:hypothetical protein [Oscillospiraceae bacterium]